jgi:purine-nucleoside phosphorylase
LGIKNIILTNAAGGINKDFKAGDIMVITDHIKFFDDSPLRGKNLDEFGPRFNDMSFAYKKEFIDIAFLAAKEINLKLKQGVYAFMPGPSFETPAEIRALSILGADAVGMSTVAEVIAACHCGMDVLGISCISNMAAGISKNALSHQEVMENAKIIEQKLFNFIVDIVKRI